MDRFEIDDNDIKLMKTMMFATYRSKYKLADVTGIPYPTLQRRIDKLKGYKMIARFSDEEVVRKNGSPDKRRPQTWDVSIKGLAYLIVNDYLKEAELEKALMRIFNTHKNLRSLGRFMDVAEYRSIVVNGVIESIFELRSKINFQYFDREYVLNLFFPLLEQAFWKRLEQLQKQSPKELKRLVKQSGMKNKIWKWYSTELEIARSQKKEAENRIGNYRTILKFVRNIR